MKQELKILLIDDDEDDRSLFCESMKEVDPNINCVTCADCIQALSYLKNEAEVLPHYIFLDLRMPGFSGRKCLEAINAEGRLKHIPVIIYTTSTDEEDAEELRAMGAVHFISKPTNPGEIYYMISQVINEKWK